MRLPVDAMAPTRNDNPGGEIPAILAEPCGVYPYFKFVASIFRILCQPSSGMLAPITWQTS